MTDKLKQLLDIVIEDYTQQPNNISGMQELIDYMASPEPINVICYVEGGMVHGARSSSPWVQLDVWDQDNIDEDEDCRPAILPDEITDWEMLDELYPYGVY